MNADSEFSLAVNNIITALTGERVKFVQDDDPDIGIGAMDTYLQPNMIARIEKISLDDVIYDTMDDLYTTWEVTFNTKGYEAHNDTYQGQEFFVGNGEYIGMGTAKEAGLDTELIKLYICVEGTNFDKFFVVDNTDSPVNIAYQDFQNHLLTQDDAGMSLVEWLSTHYCNTKA